MFKKLLPVFVFVFVIYGLAGMGILSQEKTWSAAERRELQTLPKVTIKTVQKGKFQKKYEKYLSDQFPARDTWVQVQTSVARILGKRRATASISERMISFWNTMTMKILTLRRRKKYRCVERLCTAGYGECTGAGDDGAYKNVGNA